MAVLFNHLALTALLCATYNPVDVLEKITATVHRQLQHTASKQKSHWFPCKLWHFLLIRCTIWINKTYTWECFSHEDLEMFPCKSILCRSILIRIANCVSTAGVTKIISMCPQWYVLRGTTAADLYSSQKPVTEGTNSSVKRDNSLPTDTRGGGGIRGTFHLCVTAKGLWWAQNRKENREVGNSNTDW